MYVGIKYKKKDTGEYGGRQYVYKTALPVQLDDLVIAPTANGEANAIVTELNIPDGRIDERWISAIREIVKMQEVAEGEE